LRPINLGDDQSGNVNINLPSFDLLGQAPPTPGMSMSGGAGAGIGVGVAEPTMGSALIGGGPGAGIVPTVNVGVPVGRSRQ